MKTTRLILLGVVILALAAAIWLFFQPDPQPSPADSARTSTASEPTLPVSISDPTPAPPTTPAIRPADSPASAPATLPPVAGFERRHSLERLGFDLAGTSAAAALHRLAEFTTPVDRVAFLRGMFARLAGGPSAEALRTLKALPAGLDRDTALHALIASWRPDPIHQAQVNALAERFGYVGGELARLLDNPSLAVECARELLTGSERVRLLAAAAGHEAARDPQRALSFGADLEGEQRAQFLSGLANGWALTAGEAAWAWAAAESDPKLRQQLQTEIVAGWMARDPQAAASHLSEITDPESRQRLLKNLAGLWASSDTQAAFTWANSLPDPQERQLADEAIRANAPVGIGVVLATSPDGFPLIRDLVPDSPASIAGTLKSGYQIAGIGDGRGGFTEVRNKNIGEVAQMMRGKAGTNIVLQVIPPGGNPASPVTVVIPRQQLLFKKPPGA